MKHFSALILAALLLAVAGCATPESRIKKNQALFDSYPADVQDKIKAGKVDLGFTPDMVTIALGKPGRVYQRKTADGETEVWSYEAYSTTTNRQRVNTDVRVRDNSGYRTVHDWVWVDVEQRNYYDKLRIEFTGGKVSGIEEVTSNR